jgi:hypothetical protein
MVANFATEGSTGASFTRVTAAPEFQMGLRQRGTNSRDYIYVRANGAIAAAASCKVTGADDLWQAVSGAGQHVADVAFADGEYGWVRQRFSLPDEADEVDFDDAATGWGVDDLQAAIEYINDNFSVDTHTHALDDLSDVSAATPSVNDVIAWDGAAWANTQRVRLVSQLGDVTLTGLAANEVMVWNGAAWANEADNAHMHTLSDIADAGTLAGLDSVSNGNWSGTDLAVLNGGTGASVASDARTNLGVAIGSDVQAWDAVLDSLAANADTSGALEKTGTDTVATYTVTAFGKTILDDSTAGAVRTTLGLGALAVEDSVGSGLIDNNAVTNVELADMGEATLKGRQAASGTGNPQDLSAAQARTILNVEDGADVTDAANVDAAGATMNADTSLAGNGYFLDEDNFASNAATKVASQQSIKAYVDAAAAAASVQDGDYGDITVSGSGAAWAIDNDVVTNAKLANMTQATIKGRASGAGSGDPTDLSAAQARTILNVEDGADVTDEANVTDALDGATLTDVGTPTGGDLILLQDASDSKNLKVAQFSTFGGGGGSGGLYLQEQFDTLITDFTSSSSTWTAVTGLAATITCASALNSVEIDVNMVVGTTASAPVMIRVVRDSTVVMPARTDDEDQHWADQPQNNTGRTCSLGLRDTPGDTSGHTYQVQIRTASGTARVNHTNSGAKSIASIRLREIDNT